LRTPVQLTHLLTNLLFFVTRVKTGNLAGIEKIVDVLEKRFLFDLNTPFAI